MTERMMIGYGLMLLVVLALAAFLWWKSHNTFDKKYRRQRVRDQKRYLDALDRKEEEDEEEDASLTQTADAHRSDGERKPV